MQDSITLRRERARRRKNLMSAIGKGSIAIIPSAPTKLRSKDTDYKYRQDSDFFYLTGFEEPSSVAVLIAGRRAAEYIIFCREKDPLRELWDGRRTGLAGAMEHFGADDAFPIEDMNDILPGLMCSKDESGCITPWVARLCLIIALSAGSIS